MRNAATTPCDVSSEAVCYMHAIWLAVFSVRRMSVPVWNALSEATHWCPVLCKQRHTLHAEVTLTETRQKPAHMAVA